MITGLIGLVISWGGAGIVTLLLVGAILLYLMASLFCFFADIHFKREQKRIDKLQKYASARYDELAKQSYAEMGINYEEVKKRREIEREIEALAAKSRSN